jgi:capsular polysaccharide export protein
MEIQEVAQPMKAPFLAVTRGVAAVPFLEEFLGGHIANGEVASGTVLAWGRKPSATKAEDFAARNRLPLLRIEDGFIRSIEPGADSPGYALALDDEGIYYDGGSASRLESLVGRALNSQETERARNLAALWRRERVSKYNHARERLEDLPADFVLVVDQTRGDASISFGQADAGAFQRMLDAAVLENPGATILLKVHPEVMCGRKAGHFDFEALKKNPAICVLGDDRHPAGLLEKCRSVYAVTSQMGFEGLLWGKPVRVFGMPFYAGWGLTDDELAAPSRRGSASLEQLVHAALVDYARYIDPETLCRCEVERLVEWMGLQRRMRGRFPETLHAVGIPARKWRHVRRFFQGSRVVFENSPKRIPSGSTILRWGKKTLDISVDAQNQALTLEDGFIRSVGLGAGFATPLSWVADTRGIYFDATVPSDLEHILATEFFSKPLLERAAKLREAVVTAGVTKYNVGSGKWSPPVNGKTTILVAGQVESDASIRYGAPGIKTNMELLRAVREGNPEAHVVYKPHPDVVAGLRLRGEGEGEARRWSEEVVVDVPMGRLLEAVDEVHVLTSLAGFEALLRGKPVTTHGCPFYAGWGLTRDFCEPIARRGRLLKLDELVAAALILYPVYVSRVSKAYTTPERALWELRNWDSLPPDNPHWSEEWLRRLGMFWIWRKLVAR